MAWAFLVASKFCMGLMGFTLKVGSGGNGLSDPER